MVAGNANGDKLPILVIGKARNPDALKMSSFYLVTTEINKNVDRIDGKLLEEQLRELDRKFAFEGRNVAFVRQLPCPSSY